MRKADYATLAAILQKEIRATSDQWYETEAMRHAVRVNLIHLARCISRELPVRQCEFLKACGLD
jgi:hypothetical protein